MDGILNVVGVASSSVLAVISAAQAYSVVKQKVNNRVSWRVINRGLKKILGDMRRDSYIPDCIFAMGRGGCVIAGMISNKFYRDRNVPIYMIDRSFMYSKNTKSAQLCDEFINVTKSPGSVLLVAGINASGETLNKYREWFQEHGATEIRTAVLYSNIVARVSPDYYYKKVSIDPKLFKLPWYGDGAVDWWSGE